MIIFMTTEHNLLYAISEYAPKYAEQDEVAMIEPDALGFSADVTAMAFEPYLIAMKTERPITFIALS